MRSAALLLILSLVAWPARADIVYVLNSGEASISVIDARTRGELRRIPVLREAHHLVMTPDGKSLMVGDSGANEMFFLEPLTGEVQRRVRISNPYHMEYSPGGKYLVVTSLRRDQVDIYDGPTLTLLQRLRSPDKPSHLAYSPDNKMVTVTLQGSRAIVAIDLETRQPVWQMEVGREPAGIVWNRGRLVIGIMGSDHFAVVDPETRTIERTIPIGRGAHTVFPSPDGKLLYGTSRVDSRIAVIDAETYEVRTVWEVPGGPDCIAFDPDGKLWATLRWTQRVAVIDPKTGPQELLRVGRSPHGIFVVPRRDD